MRLPAVLTAGDSATWLDDPFVDALGRNITSSGYALSYSLRGPISTAALDLQATASGSGWSTSLTSAQCAALNTGAAYTIWFWQAFVASQTERFTAGSGRLKVLPNLAAINGAVYDGRTPNEITLAAVRAEIQARQGNGFTIEYTIAGRSLKKEPLSALLTLESRYAFKVARERAAANKANGLGKPGVLGVRFQ